MRFAKQLEKRLAQATDPDEVAQLKADLHVAEVDIDYARYFPFMEPYVSLYAKAASGEKDDQDTAARYLRSPRPPMWAVIEKTREEGDAALEKLQNRQAPEGSTSAPSQEPPQHDAPAKQRSSTKKGKKGISPRNLGKAKLKSAKVGQETGGGHNNDEDGDSDGGGFFEEA